MNKKITIWIIGMLVAFNALAQNTETYYISAPHFVRPLLEKWILEYKKVEPHVNLAIAKSASNKENSSLDIQLFEESSASKIEHKTVYFGAYAILPVTTKNSDADKVLAKKELNKEKLKNLLFINEDFDEHPIKKDNTDDKIVIYTGNNNLSVSIPYASYFGKEASSFKGRRIVGDDIFLNIAIQKDPNGLTLNAIPNLYDTQSRRLKNDLSIVHLNLNKDQQTALSSLDALLTVLENTSVEGIPVEKIGFTYKNDNDTLNKFVAWVLAVGETYNHQYGLLQLKAKDVSKETSKTKILLTAEK
jgi:hypothetical protein